MSDNEEAEVTNATDQETLAMPELKESESSDNVEQKDDTNNQQTEDDVKVDIKPEDKPLEEGDLINATEDNDSKMFVGGLSWDTESFGLSDYFSKFGEVKDCTIKKDSRTERSRGFGFVLFEDPASIQKVMDVPVHYLDGRKIDPKKAQAQRKDGKLFIGGVSPDTENDKIKEHFSKFGEIEAFERPIDKSTGKKRGFCFITYKKDGILKLACAKRNQEVDGSSVEVKEAQNQERGGKFMGRGGGGMGRGGWGVPSYGAGGYGGYGNYGYDVPYNGGYGGYSGGFNQGGYGNYGNFSGGGGAYGGGGKTMKPREGSGRPRGGGWGDSRSNHTSGYGRRGNFHGTYQGYHDY